MKLEIITPDKKLFEGEVTSVQCPGIDGSFQVLENHAPIVSALKAGKVVIGGEDAQEFEIAGGVFEAANNKAILLAE